MTAGAYGFRGTALHHHSPSAVRLNGEGHLPGGLLCFGGGSDGAGTSPRADFAAPWWLQLSERCSPAQVHQPGNGHDVRWTSSQPHRSMTARPLQSRWTGLLCASCRFSPVV